MSHVDTLGAGRSRRIESFVTEWLTDGAIPGASLAVVDGDDLAYADGFGARDLEANAPATADTLFPIGSCTKSFTALAVAGLVERGDLSFDDPVTDYVGHLSGAPGDPITVGGLLSHTSGMPSDGNSSALVTPVPFSGERDLRRYVADSADQRALGRERFMYYNTGYIILGRVVEAITGERFADYVAGAIHDPLGMDRSAFDFDAVQGRDDAAKTYLMEEDGPTPAPFPHDELIHPAGGMASSARELSRYLRAMSGDGSLDGGSVVGPDLLAELQAPRATRETLLDGSERGYGYGWQTLPLLGDELVWHSGSVGVGTAFIGFLREADLGVALACNTAPEAHPKHVGPALLALLAGGEPSAVPFFALRAKSDPLLGRYESFNGVRTATVERDGAALRLSTESRLSSDTMALFPETLDPEDRRYYTVDAAGQRIPVEFEAGGDGVELFVQRWRLRKA